MARVADEMRGAGPIGRASAVGAGTVTEGMTKAGVVKAGVVTEGMGEEFVLKGMGRTIRRGVARA